MWKEMSPRQGKQIKAFFDLPMQFKSPFRLGMQMMMAQRGSGCSRQSRGESWKAVEKRWKIEKSDASGANAECWMCLQIFTQCIHVQTITRSFVRLSSAEQQWRCRWRWRCRRRRRLALVTMAAEMRVLWLASRHAPITIAYSPLCPPRLCFALPTHICIISLTCLPCLRFCAWTLSLSATSRAENALLLAIWYAKIIPPANERSKKILVQHTHVHICHSLWG